MRILHISPDFTESCGMSRYVYLLLEEYQKHNNDKLFFITNYETSALKKIEKLGIPITFINFERGNRNPMKLLMNVFKLSKFCTQNKINVIHTHHRHPELLAFLVSKLTKLRTVTTVHSFVCGLSILSFKSDAVIAVSAAVKYFLISKHKINKSKVTHLYNFVRTFRPPNMKCIETLKKINNIAPIDKVIIFVGRAEYSKGINVLCDACDQLLSEHKKLKLLIVGSINSNEIMIRIKNSANIIYLEPVLDVTDMYYLADIVVLPSIAEALGYVAIEAGLARKPFIGSRTGGITEIVEDGKSGLLCEPGNTLDLADKIKKYLDNPAMAKEHGDNLYERVKLFQNGQSYVNALRKIYLV